MGVATLMLDAQVLDGDLVCQARAGDAEASNELLLRHRAAAYRFALQLTGNREDALDVTQEALLRFLDTLDRFEAGRPVQPWLFRIVRNKAYDLGRRQRVRRAESLDELLERGMPAPAQAAPHPVEALELGELRRRVWAALARLPEMQREILVLREYEDLSYGEIGEVLGVPTGTVMSRLHRARKALRDLLSGEESDRGASDE
jgi:RNA polymerase sigma-70 factor, ECF subfamily